MDRAGKNMSRNMTTFRPCLFYFYKICDKTRVNRAFGTTETVEAHVALASGILFSLSPEQLVACATNPGHCGGTGGCYGSVPQLAMVKALKKSVHSLVS